MKKIAVVFSGCGNKDGSEITESVSLIIALNKLGALVEYFAPDIEFTPKNFLTNKPLSEKRNVMVESSRISRSQMKPLAELNPDHFDGLALPGGFGAALHLSTWASKGSQCEVLPELKSAIEKFYQQSKPIAAICIAPVIIAKVLGKHKVTVTVGDDTETALEIQKTGAVHETCPVDDFITDRGCKVITTPAYMYDDAKPDQVFTGISGLAKELIEMA
jgi:enhancing lycopene biosynthesis protein 2